MKGSPPEFTEVLLVQPPDAAALRLRTALISAPRIEVVNELTDASVAVDAAAQLQPDVVVMRVELRDVTENSVLGELRDTAPWARIVLHAHIAQQGAPGRARWIGRLIDVVVATVNSHTLEARLELPDDPRSVSLARSLLTQLLGQWEMEDFVDLATLLITELVSNAIRHVPGTCAVELTRRGDALRMAVVDTGPGVPNLQSPGLSAFGGRGLHIVSALATAWGVDRLEDGSKAVWAELSTPLAEDE
ncbi:MAG TPA: ATP-binding protein [Aeromicrobium sp.]|nr:ATP-binding protein [Aeromicrobium sp.]